MSALRRIQFDTPCRIQLEHSDEFLCAHVELADNIPIGPGDRVRVHGAPISIGFGERCSIERIATVERASTIERWWTKFAGHFEMTELYEVSFSDRSI
ncbi:hypothetical protein ACFOKI_16150 [Sphingomonas qilianensis]|uniref:Uncharacterized protein n=1 Tax=Sphingomonas qilianensis TaxID=1736690 RepID=A0ABU9XWH9_9SPHN